MDVYFVYSVIEVLKDAVYLFGILFFKDITDYKKLSHHCFKLKRGLESVNLNFDQAIALQKLLKSTTKIRCI